MTQTTEPEFYDLAMTMPGEPAMEPLEASPWRKLYEAAAAWIDPDDHVVDLGCGTGRFAECLRRNGHGRYTGLDFSYACLLECKAYVPRRDRDTAWHADFEQADLRTWKPPEQRPGGTVYTCLETLEHLAEDIDLIRRIPVGHELIFSVPNYGSQAHLRVFQNVSDAWRRYDGLLWFRAWQMVGEGPRNYIHLYRARRRPEAF